MNSPGDTIATNTDDRLDAVAQLLAEAILRRNLRRFRPTGRENISLELSAKQSLHVLPKSRSGDGAS